MLILRPALTNRAWWGSQANLHQWVFWFQNQVIHQSPHCHRKCPTSIMEVTSFIVLPNVIQLPSDRVANKKVVFYEYRQGNRMGEERFHRSRSPLYIEVEVEDSIHVNLNERKSIANVWNKMTLISLLRGHLPRYSCTIYQLSGAADLLGFNNADANDLSCWLCMHIMQTEYSLSGFKPGNTVVLK